MIRLAPFALALAALALPAISAAQVEVRAPSDPDRIVYTQQVQFAMSELSTPKGARKVLAAIESAADYVCGGRPDSASGTGAKTDYAACHRDAMTRAIGQVGSRSSSAVTPVLPVKTATLP